MSETDHDLSAFGIDRSRVLVGHVELAPSERQVFVETKRLHLSAREFDVLHVLSLLAEASPSWLYIHTHFGHGYRFEPERTDERD